LEQNTGIKTAMIGQATLQGIRESLQPGQVAALAAEMGQLARAYASSFPFFHCSDSAI
jgi:hypothetical protein